MVDTRTHIATEIRAELARQRRTHRQLGIVLNLSQPSISIRMNGTRSFRAEELVTIADWLGVPITNFIPNGHAVPSKTRRRAS